MVSCALTETVSFIYCTKNEKYFCDVKKKYLTSPEHRAIIRQVLREKP